MLAGRDSEGRVRAPSDAANVRASGVVMGLRRLTTGERSTLESPPRLRLSAELPCLSSTTADECQVAVGPTPSEHGGCVA